MPQISSSLPTLINGVSQQPFSVRLPSQGTKQDNGYSSPSEGLKKRPPTEHIALLPAVNTTKVHVHFVDRDEDERYVMLFTNGDVAVFNLDGEAFPVVTSISKTYLSTHKAAADIRCLTLADVTLILNRSVGVTPNEDESADRYAEALVWVKRGNYSTDYIVNVDGSSYTYHSDATDADKINTNYIAAQLEALLIDPGTGINVATFYDVTRYENYIWIRRKDSYSATFYITAQDGAGDENLAAIPQEVQRFSDLPPLAPRGFLCRVASDSETAASAYWVEFTPNNSANFGPGEWVESHPTRIRTDIFRPSMPHILTRKQDDGSGTVTGTPDQIYFELSRPLWGQRLVGDGETNPFPSFVFHEIEDLWLQDNRLGFLSRNNVSLSEAGSYYNFFRTTVLTVLDSDPIDIGVASTKAVTLRYAIPYAGGTLLFASNAQYLLSAAEAMTPRTVKVQAVGEWEIDPDCAPMAAEGVVFAPFINGDYIGVREFRQNPTTNQFEAPINTFHVPHYLSGPANSQAVCTTDPTLIVFPDNRNECFVYKWLVNGTDKVQSSWSRWTFGPTDGGPGQTDATIGDPYGWGGPGILVPGEGTIGEWIDGHPGAADPGGDGTGGGDDPVPFICSEDSTLETYTSAQVAFDVDEDEVGESSPFTFASGDMLYLSDCVWSETADGGGNTAIEIRLDPVLHVWVLHAVVNGIEVWYGTKNTGTDPIGTYTRQSGFDMTATISVT